MIKLLLLFGNAVSQPPIIPNLDMEEIVLGFKGSWDNKEEIFPFRGTFAPLFCTKDVEQIKIGINTPVVENRESIGLFYEGEYKKVDKMAYFLHGELYPISYIDGVDHINVWLETTIEHLDDKFVVLEKAEETKDNNAYIKGDSEFKPEVVPADVTQVKYNVDQIVDFNHDESSVLSLSGDWERFDDTAYHGVITPLHIKGKTKMFEIGVNTPIRTIEETLAVKYSGTYKSADTKGYFLNGEIEPMVVSKTISNIEIGIENEILTSTDDFVMFNTINQSKEDTLIVSFDSVMAPAIVNENIANVQINLEQTFEYTADQYDIAKIDGSWTDNDSLFLPSGTLTPIYWTDNTSTFKIATLHAFEVEEESGLISSIKSEFEPNGIHPFVGEIATIYADDNIDKVVIGINTPNVYPKNDVVMYYQGKGKNSGSLAYFIQGDLIPADISDHIAKIDVGIETEITNHVDNLVIGYTNNEINEDGQITHVNGEITSLVVNDNITNLNVLLEQTFEYDKDTVQVLNFTGRWDNDELYRVSGVYEPAYVTPNTEEIQMQIDMPFIEETSSLVTEFDGAYKAYNNNAYFLNGTLKSVVAEDTIKGISVDIDKEIENTTDKLVVETTNNERTENATVFYVDGTLKASIFADDVSNIQVNIDEVIEHVPDTENIVQFTGSWNEIDDYAHGDMKPLTLTNETSQIGVSVITPTENFDKDLVTLLEGSFKNVEQQGYFINGRMFAGNVPENITTIGIKLTDAIENFEDDFVVYYLNNEINDDGSIVYNDGQIYTHRLENDDIKQYQITFDQTLDYAIDESDIVQYKSNWENNEDFYPAAGVITPLTWNNNTQTMTIGVNTPNTYDDTGIVVSMVGGYTMEGNNVATFGGDISSMKPIENAEKLQITVVS